MAHHPSSPVACANDAFASILGSRRGAERGDREELFELPPLEGGYPDGILVRLDGHDPNHRIRGIKHLRVLTGSSLKWAKDMSDTVISGRSVIIAVRPDDDVLDQLRAVGFIAALAAPEGTVVLNVQLSVEELPGLRKYLEENGGRVVGVPRSTGLRLT
jgi:ribosomal protein L7/L12